MAHADLLIELQVKTKVLRKVHGDYSEVVSQTNTEAEQCSYRQQRAKAPRAGASGFNLSTTVHIESLVFAREKKSMKTRKLRMRMASVRPTAAIPKSRADHRKQYKVLVVALKKFRASKELFVDPGTRYFL